MPDSVETAPLSRREARRRWRWKAAARHLFAPVLGVAIVATAALTLAGRLTGAPLFAPACHATGGGQVAAPRTADRAIGLASWTSFEGNQGHNLVVPGTPTGGAPLLASWAVHLGGAVNIAPAVVGGVMYVAASDSCVYALDARSGSLLWSSRTDAMMMSEPIVDHGRVVVGTGNKTVYQKRDPKTGKLVWQRGTRASAIVSLSARTGHRLWLRATAGENMPTGAEAGGVIYAADGSGTFYALDAKTGNVLWTIPVPLDSMSSVVLDGNIAVVGGAQPYEVYGVDIAKHALAWTFRMPQAEGGVDDLTATVSAGVAFVQVPEGVYPNATVVEFAINTQTGRNLWQTELGKGVVPAANKEEAGVATATGGALYVGSPALHGLWALDQATGKPLWAKPTPLPVGVRASPTVDATHVYVEAQGELFVIDRASGALEQTISVGRPADESVACTTPAPELVGNTLYFFGGTENTLIAANLSAVLAGDLPKVTGL